jgi:hypothetical protein
VSYWNLALPKRSTSFFSGKQSLKFGPNYFGVFKGARFHGRTGRFIHPFFSLANIFLTIAALDSIVNKYQTLTSMQLVKEISRSGKAPKHGSTAVRTVYLCKAVQSEGFGNKQSQGA